MRRTWFFLVLWCVASAARAGISIVSDSNEQTVLRIESSGLTQERVDREQKPYSQIRIKGFEFASKPGTPEVPHADAILAVPNGADFTITIDSRKIVRPIALKYDVSFAKVLPVHNGRPELATRLPEAYSKIYGDELVEILESGYAGPDKILSLRFWPVRYDAPKKSLLHTSEFFVKVSFPPSRDKQRRNGSSIAKAVVINPSRVANRAANPRYDLIIAHSMYQMDLFRLVEFKMAHGRKVKQIIVDKKSSQEIKAIIQNEYRSADPPSETILVGNLVQIPAFSGDSSNTWTDYPYQLLDSDSVPDIAMGRIPASNVDELATIVDKIIFRETAPRQIDNILITAGRDTSMGCPANVTKVGDNLKMASSHIQITKRFRTEVSTDSVIAGYNDNPNLIVYDGHGDRQGMQEVPLVISNLNRLTNNVFPIILDIACLNANWSSSANWRNFTTEILFQQMKGVAGIMSSGGSGDGHAFFRSIGQLMADAKKNLSTDTRMNEIGQIILAAKIKHGQQDRSYWNYYGDPASSVWESTY